MKYQIINNLGILLDGHPELLPSDLTLTFEGSSDGTEVIINTGESVFYRKISGGVVTLDKRYLEKGELYVTVSPGIRCDKLYVTREGGAVIVSGDYSEREAIIKKLRSEVSSLTERVEKLDCRLHEIYDGYELL